MKVFLSFALYFILVCSVNSQDLYSKAFGDSKKNAIIYLHGGPGYNSVSFEVSTAEQLAKRGFYVIVYDRRGEGRSLDKDIAPTYTFEQTLTDLRAIYEIYGIEKATLIGHSFGGVIATLFAEAHPEYIEKLVLVSTPIQIQESFQNIHSGVNDIYLKNKDTVNLHYLALLDKMDTESLEYASYTLMHAMHNGFYTSKTLSEEAKARYAQTQAHSLFQKYANQMVYQATKGFWQNEQYTSLDLTEKLKFLRHNNIRIQAIYGKQDGLFSKEQIHSLKESIGADNVRYLEDASHNVFMDTQEAFIEAVGFIS